MQLNLRVTFTDGTTRDVSAIAADFVKFESRFDLSIARLGQEVKFTHMLYLAWAIETRTKQTTNDFETWVENVASIEALDAKK